MNPRGELTRRGASKRRHTSNVISKYLDTYAEPETQLLTHSLQPWPAECHFDHVLVIPAYRESAAFFERLALSLMREHSVLLIVVINQPDTLTGVDIENSSLWKNLVADTSLAWHHRHLQLRTLATASSAVLLVDRFSEVPIPHKQGVGLARKIGADLALALIAGNYISGAWIYSSDADAQLPDNYFSVIDKTTEYTSTRNTLSKNTRSKNDSTEAAAAVFPFKHICADDNTGRATQLYELHMRQYVDGLRAANSPYAYHTLGSALAIKSTAYAKVRGFPKRNGGEDFYLLNKAAKTGPILELAAGEIQIEARLSDRVPFGTGPAIERLLATQEIDNAKIFYHPDVYKHLAHWLKVIPNTWTKALTNQGLPTFVIETLQSLDIHRAIDNARRTSRTQETYLKHMHTWFDGFKTLRFIHLLRDGGLDNIALAELDKLSD